MSTYGEPAEGFAIAGAAAGFHPMSTAEARVVARKVIEDDAASIALGLRQWFGTWALDLYRQLASEIGDDSLVTHGSLDLVVQNPSIDRVAQAICSVDRHWRLALGLAAGRWDEPPESRSIEPLPPRDLGVVLSETMFSPDEFGLTLASAGAGSLRSTWEKSGTRKLLLSQELAALLSVLAFAGVTGPGIAQHLAVHGSDKSRCELSLAATGLPTELRDRLLEETARLPGECSISISLHTSSGQTAKLTFPEAFPRPKLKGGTYKI